MVGVKQAETPEGETPEYIGPKVIADDDDGRRRAEGLDGSESALLFLLECRIWHEVDSAKLCVTQGKKWTFASAVTYLGVEPVFACADCDFHGPVGIVCIRS